MSYTQERPDYWYKYIPITGDALDRDASIRVETLQRAAGFDRVTILRTRQTDAKFTEVHLNDEDVANLVHALLNIEPRKEQYTMPILNFKPEADPEDISIKVIYVNHATEDSHYRAVMSVIMQEEEAGTMRNIVTWLNDDDIVRLVNGLLGLPDVAPDEKA